MPRLISFALTTDQVRARTKTVTRRLGWRFLRPGDRLTAVVKAQGLKKGERPEVLAQIEVVSVSRQALWMISPEDVEREGFPDLTPHGFTELFRRANGCGRNDLVTRIEFRYLDEVPR